MATKKNNAKGVNKSNALWNDENSVAAKLFDGVGTEATEEGLSSGLTKLTTGDYTYKGCKNTIINGNKQTLALWSDEEEQHLYACGGSRFATQALGAVGKKEQLAALKDPENIGTEWHLTVTGEGSDKVITFEQI